MPQYFCVKIDDIQRVVSLLYLNPNMVIFHKLNEKLTLV